jgi:hypothetical protein
MEELLAKKVLRRSQLGRWLNTGRLLGLGRTGDLSQGTAVRRLKLAGSAALLLLPVDRAPGLLLQDAGLEMDVAGHDGFLKRALQMRRGRGKASLKNRAIKPCRLRQQAAVSARLRAKFHGQAGARTAARRHQACSAAHISWSRSAVQMRGFLMPLASS